MLRRVGRGEWTPPTLRNLRPPPHHIVTVAANDAVNWTDVAVGVAAQVSLALDTVGFSDGAFAVSGFAAAANDAMAFVDSALGQTVAQFGLGEDTLEFSDGALSTSERIAVATDALTLSDTAVTASTLIAAALDALTLTDTAVGGRDSVTVAADTLSVSDSSVAEAFSFFGDGVDTIAFTEGAVALTSRVAAASDSLSRSDTAVALTARVSVAADSLSRSDGAVALTARVATASDSRSVSDSAVGGPSGAGYVWFNAFDMNLFPPHSAAGAYGVQSPIQEAAGPTITSTGTASNEAQLADACYTPGTQVTLTDEIDGAVLNDEDIVDACVVVPTGARLLRPFFGSASGDRQITRLMIRGDTLGTFGGGQTHEMSFFGPIDDLVVDGVNMSGPGGNNGAISIQKNLGGPAQRFAIQNIRANCGGYFLLCNIDHPTIVNCSILTAQDTTDPVEAWGLRFSRDTLGNVIVYGCDIRASTARGGVTNNTYHRSRQHPNPGSLYNWHYGSTFIDRVQSRIFLVDAAFGSGTGILSGTWFQSCLVIGSYAAGANGRELRITDSVYGRIINNLIQSDQITSIAQLTLGPLVTDGDKTTGNVFQALPVSDPAWGATGDPSGIPWNI